ncbi:MAG: YicC family protein [candidate division Zixibacteria bacterium]|nr:YicC family protein [candidate division Zixibacteria bacterium]
MLSMTGFGRSEVKAKNSIYTIEVSSLNSRFLEISFRLPRHLSAVEHSMREILRNQISRGKVTVVVAVRGGESGPVECAFNEEVADFYVKRLRTYQKKRSLGGEVTISDLMSITEIFQNNLERGDDPKLQGFILKGLKHAVADMLKTRQAEGKHLAADMVKRLKIIETKIAKIVKLSKMSVSRYRTKLRNRIARLLEGIDVNGNRLEEEIAIMADRTEITEEVIRLGAHLDSFRKNLKSNKPIGKRLNFLLQEFNRETNTIGSKSIEANIAQEVIQVKEEIEKIREQVQNVE